MSWLNTCSLIHCRILSDIALDTRYTAWHLAGQAARRGHHLQSHRQNRRARKDHISKHRPHRGRRTTRPMFHTLRRLVHVPLVPCALHRKFHIKMGQCPWYTCHLQFLLNLRISIQRALLVPSALSAVLCPRPYSHLKDRPNGSHARTSISQ